MSRSVPITLDRERQLRLDFNALGDADQLAGERINELLTGQHVGLAAMRALIWAGLKHEDRRLTLEQTGEIIGQFLESGGTLVELRTAINQALLAGGLLRGDADEKNGQPETQTQNP